MIMIYVACYDVCYIFLYMEDIMVYVLHISIWKTLWHMYNAAAGAFMRYAGGRLGRWGCSRLLNRVAPPGGDGGLHARAFLHLHLEFTANGSINVHQPSINRPLA